jgi:hypothetical protein
MSFAGSIQNHERGAAPRVGTLSDRVADETRVRVHPEIEPEAATPADAEKANAQDLNFDGYSAN